MDDNDREAAAAAKVAKKARFWELLFSIMWPLFCIAYALLSPEPLIVRALGVVLVWWSGQALVGTYGSKKEAALSKKAGYENP